MNVKSLFSNRPDEVEFTVSRCSGDSCNPVSVVLNNEHELKLYGGNMLLHTFVCSPSELDELCVGWLQTEGYSADAVEIAHDGHTATAQGAPAIPTEPETYCLSRSVSVSTEEMLQRFNSGADKHTRSHGIHECVIKGDGWHMLRTDIGRHNAIDKAVGAAVMAGHDLTGAVMFSSGRINVQTVKKAVRCRIGCLMSKAVITREALELAEKLGLNVLFSVKDSSYFTK